MRLLLPATVMISFLLWTHSVVPAQTPPGTEDRAAIQAVVDAESEAWNRGDAEAFAAHYAENGSFTNVIGMQIYGRRGFVEQHRRIFGTIYKGSRCTFTIGHLALLRPDVAVVDVDSKLMGFRELPPGLKAQNDGAVHTKLQLVMTRENGIWWIAAFHNVAVMPLPGT